MTLVVRVGGRDIVSFGVVVHTWKKFLRQKIMSSLTSMSIQNLFIFALLIHYIVLIDNQALANIHINVIFIFFSYSDIVSTQKNLVMKGKCSCPV